MVRGQRAAAIHAAPASPSLGLLVDGVGPDPLAPDDILDVEGLAVVHDPLGNLAAGESSILEYTSAWGCERCPKRALTPPWSEIIMSVARPQQWSELPLAPHVQSRTQPISRTRPGKAATI